MLVVPPDGIWRVPPPCTGGAACILLIEATPKSTNAAIVATASTFLCILPPLGSGRVTCTHSDIVVLHRGNGGEAILRSGRRSAKEWWFSDLERNDADTNRPFLRLCKKKAD